MQPTSKWFLGLALGTAALATTATAVSAVSDAPAGRGEIRALVRTRLSEAGFTPMQKLEATRVFRRHAPNVVPLVRQLVQERRALRDLMQSDKLDEAAIRAQSARLSQVQAEMHVQAARALQDLRRIATPEQQGKLRQLEREVREKVDARLEALGAWLTRS